MDNRVEHLLYRIYFELYFQKMYTTFCTQKFLVVLRQFFKTNIEILSKENKNSKIKNERLKAIKTSNLFWRNTLDELHNYCFSYFKYD